MTYDEALAFLKELGAAGVGVSYVLTLTRRLEPRSIDMLWRVVQTADVPHVNVVVPFDLDPEIEAELLAVKEFVEPRP